MPTQSAWRSYERHEISARYPDLTGPAWEDFLASIKRNKVRGRSITLHQGKILDGWQLYRACLALDIQPLFCNLRDGEDPEEFVEQANEHRRHESPEQMVKRLRARRERIAKAHAQGASTRTIADQEGISQSAVRGDLEEAKAQAPAKRIRKKPIKSAPSGTVSGKDGKIYPASKPRRQGSILFDWPDFTKSYGLLLRQVDRFGNAHHCKECPAAEGLRRKLEEWRQEFRKWAEFQTKARVPS